MLNKKKEIFMLGYIEWKNCFFLIAHRMQNPNDTKR